MKETVECLECGREFKTISVSHLKTHGMTMAEYREKYPDAILTSEKSRGDRRELSFGENNPHYNPDLVRELTGIENIDYVVCQICRSKLLRLTHRHLMLHGITVDEYTAKYPKAFVSSEKSFQNSSKATSGWLNDETRNGKFLAALHTDEYREKQRIKTKARHDDPVDHARMIAGLNLVRTDPVIRDKWLAIMRDDTRRKIHSFVMSSYFADPAWKSVWLESQRTDDVRKVKSDNMFDMHNDPELHDKWLKLLKSETVINKQRVASLQNWADPEYYARMEEIFSSFEHAKSISMGHLNNHDSWVDFGYNLTGNIYSTPEYYKWRKLVYGRDNHRCKLCGGYDCIIHAHHIKRAPLYPELMFDVDNGITLCERCHRLTFGKEELFEEELTMIVSNTI